MPSERRRLLSPEPLQIKYVGGLGGQIESLACWLACRLNVQWVLVVISTVCKCLDWKQSWKLFLESREYHSSVFVL